MAIVFAECGGDVCVLWPQHTHVTNILPIAEVAQDVSAQSGQVHDVILSGMRKIRLRKGNE